MSAGQLPVHHRVGLKAIAFLLEDLLEEDILIYSLGSLDNFLMELELFLKCAVLFLWWQVGKACFSLFAVFLVEKCEERLKRSARSKIENKNRTNRVFLRFYSIWRCQVQKITQKKRTPLLFLKNINEIKQIPAFFGVHQEKFQDFKNTIFCKRLALSRGKSEQIPAF